MAWLKLTSETLYLMKGGTNLYLNKIDLAVHNKEKEEFILDVPKQWFRGNDIPKTMVIDIGSTEKPEKAPDTPKSDSADVFSKVIKRADWSAAPPVSRFEIVDRPKYIVIHHTDHNDNPSKGTLAGAKKLTKDIQTFHMTDTKPDKPWSDIGYNFLNSVGGFLLEGRAGSLEEAIRGNSVRGAHAGTADGNRSPGVANEGNFSVNGSMPKEQWESLVKICAALCQSCGIDPANIRGHKDFVATTCPGEWLYSQLPKLRLEVAQRLAK
jgi:hypothetical protein